MRGNNVRLRPERIIRSARKTLAAEIKDGGLVIRAPYFVSEAEIRSFIEANRSRIEKHMKKAAALESRKAEVQKLTDEELADLAKRAAEAIGKRAAYYAPLIGVKYGRITIRKQRSRWGSCSAKGNLSFNCLLMLAPPEVMDGVVVHELCHIKHMDHSKRFYAEVLKAFPDYHESQKWLKRNGALLIAALPEK